jgi:hypothetical protein
MDRCVEDDLQKTSNAAWPLHANQLLSRPPLGKQQRLTLVLAAATHRPLRVSKAAWQVQTMLVLLLSFVLDGAQCVIVGSAVNESSMRVSAMNNQCRKTKEASFVVQAWFSRTTAGDEQ